MKKSIDTGKIMKLAAAIAMFIISIALLLFCVLSVIEIVKDLRPAEAVEELPADEPAEGVARIPTVERYLGAAEDASEYHALAEYREGDGPAPEWFRPEEPMSAEWFAKDINVVRKDIGCPDWNLDTSLVGWDGHRAEAWELDLYARIVYLEFWGTSPECCEAGADSILRLWESGYYGETLGETLTARAEDGSLVYSPYAYVWDWEYDLDGLADMRALCEERFYGGPEWEAPFFRLWYYHDWAVPCYEIDGVYFSTGEGWQ